MGWIVKVKEEKGQPTKYRLWSTNSDSYLTEWVERDGVLHYMFWHNLDKFVQKFMEEAYSFPQGWPKEDYKMHTSKEGEKSRNEFFDLCNSRYKQKKGEPDILWEKFDEVVKRLNIK